MEYNKEIDYENLRKASTGKAMSDRIRGSLRLTPIPKKLV